MQAKMQPNSYHISRSPEPHANTVEKLWKTMKKRIIQRRSTESAATMSLYALLQSPSTDAVGYDLAQTLIQQQQTFEEEERKAKMASTEKHIVVDLARVNQNGVIHRSGSLSSITHDGFDDMSLASSFSTKERHEWIVRVEEAMINYKNLVRPPRDSGRASVSRRSRDSRLCHRRNTAKAFSFHLDPTETALEFRLVVSYAGRTYCTKRTLLQIAQCRRNLIEELEWANSKMNNLEDRTTLPEIPRMGESLFCSAGGFNEIKGMTNAYKEPLQRWFEAVISIVSDENPILSDFLWEPLDCSCNRDSLHAGMTNLGIIKEVVVNSAVE